MTHDRRSVLAAAGIVLACSAVGLVQSPPPAVPTITVPSGGAVVEQTSFGAGPPAALAASFDGLGAGFTGPQGSALLRNPSDNSLAVGPDHIVQIVNTRMAIFTKKGKRFDTTGRPLYGPVPTNNVFRGFGGSCESRNNGDAVVRYDQIADRWLIVMPVFSRAGGAAGSAGRVERRRARLCESARTSRTTWAGRPAVSTAAGSTRRADRRCRPEPGRRPTRRIASGTLLDVLRGEHQLRSARELLPLRIPPPAVSGLSAARDLVRRLLRADQHQRRPDFRACRDPEARLRRRSSEDAGGQTGGGAVRHCRKRELPQQRRHRRQESSARQVRRM